MLYDFLLISTNFFSEYLNNCPFKLFLSMLIFGLGIQIQENDNKIQISIRDMGMLRYQGEEYR